MRQYLTIRDFINIFPAGWPVQRDLTDQQRMDLRRDGGGAPGAPTS
jgi:hypothetical protein